MTGPWSSEYSAAALRNLAARHAPFQFRLPDGELGRPGDNEYVLTYLAARPHKLLIEFDEQLLLVVTEPDVRRADDVCVELGFASLTFDWQGYIDLTPHVSSYSSGDLRIWLSLLHPS